MLSGRQAECRALTGSERGEEAGWTGQAAVSQLTARDSDGQSSTAAQWLKLQIIIDHFLFMNMSGGIFSMIKRDQPCHASRAE